MTRVLDRTGGKNLGDRWADRAFRDQFRMNLSEAAQAKPQNRRSLSIRP